MADLQEFELKYSHNIVEHLGLKLYQNRPVNVISELISNSWDADADNIWIELIGKNKSVSVFDDGDGMSKDELINDYLVIGKKKRARKDLDSVSKKGRKLMGRKGIGKLAPFGIANTLEVITISKKTKKCCWIKIDLSGLLHDGPENSNSHLIYHPDVILDDADLSDLQKKKNGDPLLESFLDRCSEGGTLIIMSDPLIKKAISQKQMERAIGRRFTITLMDKKVNVFVNGSPVSHGDAFPDFAFRIPESGGYESKIINVGGKHREVRYWVGFIEQADWPQDQSGVGVYAHGKIAQDRPFVFGVKGREISTRYMFGVLEADWLDELPEDVVSTDRTSVNWENPATEELYEWGQNLVKVWINEYRKFQKENNEEKISRKLTSLPGIPKVTVEEKNTIKEMVCSMSPRIYKDEGLQNEVIHNLTSAWTHRPTRNIIKNLWDRIQGAEINEEDFVKTLDDIYKHLVPESLSLSVTVAQKIYALTKLYELSMNGTETQLQRLLEKFPWILGSDKGKVFANTSMKEMARVAALQGRLPSHGSTGKELKDAAASPDASARPDFCFFSDANNNNIIVVELKSPDVYLEYKHLTQLITYFYWLKEKYPDAKISGYLIGKNVGSGVVCDDPGISIITWDKVCLHSRKDYLELLASMLYGIPEHYDDSRVTDVIEFGGESAKILLSRMADADTPLHDLFQQLDGHLDA